MISETANKEVVKHGNRYRFIIIHTITSLIDTILLMTCYVTMIENLMRTNSDTNSTFAQGGRAPRKIIASGKWDKFVNHIALAFRTEEIGFKAICQGDNWKREWRWIVFRSLSKVTREIDSYDSSASDFKISVGEMDISDIYDLNGPNGVSSA